jgi:hypothetical protein
MVQHLLHFRLHGIDLCLNIVLAATGAATRAKGTARRADRPAMRGVGFIMVSMPIGRSRKHRRCSVVVAGSAAALLALTSVMRAD